ncbi:hypothetical protein Psi02_19570 [Planotetraspora silvatica]|uniref:Uncharacterized protein n=1 Tax=Planotetraspora silvatica TaxID=234614 RepID=A0A8J3UHR7_9ACTN|nr:hypothetical protein Psi02_19570 [Planotetraspora silvatica]
MGQFVAAGPSVAALSSSPSFAPLTRSTYPPATAMNMGRHAGTDPQQGLSGAATGSFVGYS